ncbi:hypothetical protein LSCM4_06878 [Leishmania orientalis]|uniref:Uncharacterized protein n=1 Tax=Leishmania orientalis TaxID=2249476 RepID=A0A836H921_9TRYP|nr:hypothetical protein LSCM4_06878 [Leishmania orientalis]
MVASRRHTKLSPGAIVLREESACNVGMQHTANDTAADNIGRKKLVDELNATKKMLWAAEDIILDERILAARLERQHLPGGPSLLLSFSLFCNFCAVVGICCLLQRRTSQG